MKGEDETKYEQMDVDNGEDSQPNEKSKNKSKKKYIYIILVACLLIVCFITFRFYIQKEKKIILIIGASGSQGGEVLKQLQKQNKFKLRALQRKESDFAKKARKEGIEIAIGDLYNEESLVKAMKGVYGVFSVLTISMSMEADAEIIQEKNIVSAAEKNSVQILIHASVARAGDQKNFVDWDNKERGPFYHEYWNGKSGANDVVKQSKIKHWVIFKPAWMMDNFLRGRHKYTLPTLEEGLIENNFRLDTKLDLICAMDQGKFVADAFDNIEKYDKKEIDLASQSLTFTEMADVLFKVFNKKIKVVYTEGSELLKRGVDKAIIDSNEWHVLEGYKVDIEKLKPYGIKLTTFEEFCNIYKNNFEFS